MQSNPIQIHVATNGSDSWSGKLAEPDKAANDGPLASLEGARLAVRKLVRDKRPTGTIEVLIQAGTYPIHKTVVFDLEDSGGNDLAITYKAASAAAKPVFTAAVEVDNWHRCTSLPQHMPTDVDADLWGATIPGNAQSFSIIFEDGVALKRARAKGFTPTVSGHWQDEECWRLGSRTQLHFPKGAMRRYENIEDVEIVIRPWCLWTMNILPLADVDEENNIATTAVEGTYFLTRERYHRFPDETVWVENIPEGMLQAGNWLLNSRQRKLYLLTRKGARPGRVTVPTLRELIRVEGEIDEQGDTDTPVSHLSFENLTFIEGDRDKWSDHHKGVQHDWEMWDEGNALLRFRGAENCRVANCTFGPAGGSGIRLDLHARYNRIEGCHIANLGGTGIFLGGYGAGLKAVNDHNTVINNRIHDCGQHFWHAAGILLHQSGHNRIAHNLLYNLPYSAIVLAGIRPGYLRSQVREAVKSGNRDFDRSFEPIKENMRTQTIREVCTHIRWDEVQDLDDFEKMQEMVFSLPFIHTCHNDIAYNEIHDIMQVLGDGNGIYISDCGPYNHIRHNHIYNMTHAFGVGIRTDESQRNTLVEGNLIHDCRGGLAVSRNNMAWNNVIAFIRSTGESGEAGAHTDREVFVPIYFHVDRGDGDRDGNIQRNICYHSGSEEMRFNLEKVPTDASTPRMLSNFNYFHWVDQSKAMEAVMEQLREKGFDSYSQMGDPGFENPEQRDFRLKANAPARKLGIYSLPVGKMGLQC